MQIVNIIKNSFLDFPGKIACIVFTRGCNWNCWYCQNRTLLSREQDNTEEFFDFLKSRQGWLDGVVVCGGEPTIHKDLPEFIKKIKDLGFAVKLDTNGTNPEMIEYLINNKLVDYIAMDIKAPVEKLPQIIQTTNHIEKLDKSIKILLQNRVDYEFRTTVTPDLNIEDIEKMANSIKGASKYILQQYHKPDEYGDYLEPLELEVLTKMLEKAQKITKTYLR